MLRFILKMKTRRSAITAKEFANAKRSRICHGGADSSDPGNEQDHQIDLATALGEDAPDAGPSESTTPRCR